MYLLTVLKSQSICQTPTFPRDSLLRNSQETKFIFFTIAVELRQFAFKLNAIFNKTVAISGADWFIEDP